MLKRLYVDNYKCFDKFELKFDELTLLVGRNGAGKTSVLDVLVALREVLGGATRVYEHSMFSTKTLTRWQNRRTQVVELGVELAGDAMTYRLELLHEPETQRARIQKEVLTASDGPLFSFVGGEVQLYKDNHDKGPSFPTDWSMSDLGRVPPNKDNVRLSRFVDYMRNLVVCGLDPHAMSAESTNEDASLARDGANFTAWYRHVVQERPEHVPAFWQALKPVIDGFESARLEKVGVESRALVATLRQGGASYNLRFDELSHGQRAVFAYYALLHLAGPLGCTLVLDEPDNFVALPEIQPWAAGLADRCGTELRQAIVVSHHPELIDYLGPEHGTLLDRESSGPVVARKLEVGSDTGLKLSETVARGWQK